MSCAICSKGASQFNRLYDFRYVLKDLGIEGTHAHAGCVVEAKRKHNRRADRCAMPPIRPNWGNERLRP